MLFGDFGIAFVLGRVNNVRVGIKREYFSGIVVRFLLTYVTAILVEAIVQQYMEFELTDDSAVRQRYGSHKRQQRVRKHRQLVKFLARSVKRINK